MKQVRLVLSLLMLLACPAYALAGADNFRIDAVHSQVFFSASHAGYTNPSGRMHVKEGSFRFDADDWSQAQVDATVDIASLDMGDAPWNSKMLNSFFDVTHYPTAHFVSTRVEKTGDRTGVVHGKLTLLDKTRPIDLQVTFNRAAVNGYTLQYVAGFSATATFKRSLVRHDARHSECRRRRRRAHGDRGRARRQREAAIGFDANIRKLTNTITDDMLKSDADHWGNLAKFFHWTIVLLIIVQGTRRAGHGRPAEEARA